MAARSAAGWGRVPQCYVDQRQYPFEISINFIVPESKDCKPILDEAPVPPCIPLGMRIEIVLAAVDLHNEFVAHADEINDVTLARRLSPEMKAALAPRTEMNPQLHLLRRHSLA